MSLRVGQAAPSLPGANFATAFDSINQSLYTALASDPVIGPLFKAVPPPPKVSAFFAGQARALPNLPGLPPFPLLPQAGAKQTVTNPVTGGRSKSPFS